jgi:hypothetical protein
MLKPSVVGEMHYGDPTNVEPFAIGTVDPSSGFLHVFDDTTLDIVMRELDTTADFVDYLSKKEAFIQSGRLVAAAGEEELLGFYLAQLNDSKEHDFVLPQGDTHITLLEGIWNDYLASPERMAKVEANEVSYCWDRLIETFSHHILAGTSYGPQIIPVNEREEAIRFLAGECRTARRILARSLLQLLEKSRPNMRSTRVILPFRKSSPYFLFLLLPHLPNIPESDYREVRRNLLEALCMVVKVIYPDAQDIVGFASESGRTQTGSEDAIYLDARNWSQEHQVEAESLQRDLGLLTKLTGPYCCTEQEYPVARRRTPASHRTARSVRNSRCPCGSGAKYKRCCGSNR